VTCAWPPNKLERGFKPTVTFYKVTRDRAHDVAQQLILAQDIYAKNITEASNLVRAQPRGRSKVTFFRV
jgi:hypothetical protein